MAAVARPSRSWLPVSRAPVLILSGERVLCPHLHALPDTSVELPHGLRQCREREEHDRYGRPCNAWLWVFQHGDGTRTVVPLVDEQAEYIREHPLMTVLQIRDFLGMRWVAA